jgi:hypothetical protein
LTYLNARYYDPAIGRFLSPDPLMNPGNPKTLDPYMYAANNPVTFMDATGLCYGLDAKQMAACATAAGASTVYQRAALSVAKSGGTGSSGGRKTDPTAWQPDRSGCGPVPCLNANMKNALTPTALTHTLLDAGGFVPGIGTAVDLGHGALYAQQGDWGTAAMYGMAAIPMAGDYFAGSRMALKLRSGAYATRTLGDLTRVVHNRGLPREVVEATTAHINMKSNRTVMGPYNGGDPTGYVAVAKSQRASYFSLTDDAMYAKYGEQANILFIDLVAAKRDVVQFTISRSAIERLPAANPTRMEMERLVNWHSYQWVNDTTMIPGPNPFANALFGTP